MINLSSIEKLLAAFIVFILVMLVARIGFANNLHYAFLLWNLFLAWVPFQLSVLLVADKRRQKWQVYFLLAAWLLFFPNALYIITDLIHLQHWRADVPVWFDAILLFTCSFAGLVMAFASLLQVEFFVRKNLTQKHTDKLVLLALFLGSFGVYVGRFLRWNSWDILTNPFSLLMEIARHIIWPVQHYKTWVVTMLLTVLFSLIYFLIKKMPALLREQAN